MHKEFKVEFDNLLEEVIRQAFKAGKDRARYEIVQLNFSYDVPESPAALTEDEYVEAKLNA